MDKRIKKLWIDALTGKSKKKYTQGKYRLRDNGNFCCLGVLCDIHRTQFNRRWQSDIEEGRGYCDEGFVLPKEVYKWAGLNRGDPKTKKMGIIESGSLVAVNDRGYSFDQIAQIIKQQL